MRELKCTKCKVFKPTTEFYRNAAKATGFADTCKACRREYRCQPMDRDKWLRNNQQFIDEAVAAGAIAQVDLIKPAMSRVGGEDG